jgi:hypothetical protein
MSTGMSPSNGFHSSHPSPSPEGPIRPLSPSLDFGVIDSDDGYPTDDVHADLLRVLQLIHSERHLVALTLFLSVEERLKNDLNLLDEETSLESHGNEPDGMSIPLSPSTRRTFLPPSTFSRRKKNTSKDMGTDNHHLYRQRISALKLMRDKQEEFDVLKVRFTAKEILSYAFCKRLFTFITVCHFHSCWTETLLTLSKSQDGSK